jgi:hypothetical protein
MHAVLWRLQLQTSILTLQLSALPNASVPAVQRGLAPRVFEYLFSEIDKAQDEQVSTQGSS